MISFSLLKKREKWLEGYLEQVNNLRGCGGRVGGASGDFPK